ncbi:Major facilitator superfamily domain, general substrate transporter [Pleurostoma richardsiae]|uniref:Major facilitator superfamily domain, general substrate transporter n=1 Tax=Pleurostoma richardsiae TaxID=41990 RepID=A0AA38VHW4_9PEZI|nr:Major facilitator superfamily domain, general substrate transporter [Pleurostoma richardsiae]
MSDGEIAKGQPRQSGGEDHELGEKHLGGDDVGMEALNGTVVDVDVDGPEARRVLRKIDLNLMPLLCVTYLIQFLDKSCVSYAALWGMKTDAHLVGDQYSWLTTIFYLGYMASEFPANILFQKFNITLTCGIAIVLWGVVLLCMTGADNFPGLLVARMFLGMLESGVSPCFVLLTSMFYRRNEQPLRTGIWFSMNGLANILGGLIGYGIGFIKADIPAWKFPFVIFGSATILWGFLFLWLAPSNPTKARWLTPEEKSIAVLRLADNETGIDNKHFKWYQVKEAVMDPAFWLLNLNTIANTIPNGSVTAFGPLIVNGFGFTKFQSTLLNMPSGACQIMALWISGYITLKVKGVRHFVMIGGVFVAIIGSALIYALPDSHRVARLIGYYLLVGFSVTFVQGLNLIQANVAGRTKKTVFTASIFVTYCVGNLIGPQLFFEHEAPRYQSGFASMLVCFGVQVLFVGLLYVVYLRENRKRDRFTAGAPPAEEGDMIMLGLSDKTDKENLHFRYVL